MTEAEWLSSSDPKLMLDFIGVGKARGRKLHLFAAACCRRIWHLLPDEECQRAVVVAEGFADGQVGLELLCRAEEAGAFYQDNADDVSPEGVEHSAGGAIFQLCRPSLRGDVVAFAASEAVYRSTVVAGKGRGAAEEARRAEAVAQCNLIRCFFGPLYFRPITLDPDWLTLAVGASALTAYNSRASDHMTEIAGALEGAGCTDTDTIAHCHGPGPHVRGCWVVDLILGKS